MNKTMVLYHPVGYCLECEKVIIDPEHTSETGEFTASFIECPACDNRKIAVTAMRRMEHEVYDEES